MRQFILAALALFGLSLATPASASLNLFQAFSGEYDVSSGGCATLSQACNITVNAPVGATVVGAYLYTSTFSNASLAGVGGTFAGNSISYTNLGVNGVSCCQLAAGRADVTGIVAGTINGGAGGAYTFSYTETSSSQDGGGLVLVYSKAGLATQTVAILDGFSSSTGDSATLNFAQALDPSAAGFRAEMRIGDGFSCCNQASTITVNGVTITTNAGNNDDALESLSNGNLFTIGGDNDPFSPFLPSYAADHERYNLIPQITLGDTSLVIGTTNPSNDDNIFVAIFAVSGAASITDTNGNTGGATATPEPASMALLGAGLAALGLARRRRG